MGALLYGWRFVFKLDRINTTRFFMFSVSFFSIDTYSNFYYLLIYQITRRMSWNSSNPFYAH